MTAPERFIKFVETKFKRNGEAYFFHELKFGCSKMRIEHQLKKFSFEEAAKTTCVDFLSKIAPNDELDIGVLNVLPAKNILSVNDESAPICNLGKNVGFAAFGWWTGESDGDAWAFDLKNGNICSIPVGCHGESYEEIKENVYAVCETPNDWVTYLIDQCIKREWLHPAEKIDLA